MLHPADLTESVFSYIAATAEPAAKGYRWQTCDYENRLQYHYSIFNGVGGIPIFLSAYFEVSGDPRALELARGAIEWAFDAEPSERNFKRGVQMGKLGLAYAAGCISRVSGRQEFPDFIANSVDQLLSEPPGPITDFISGEASNGWFLIQLWQATGDRRCLEGACRSASWLEAQLTRDDLGTHCLVDPGPERFGSKAYTGLAHGISGVAYFFACLYAATSDFHWKELAVEILDTLIYHGIPDRGGLNWSPVLGSTELSRCQYSHGAPGIGLVFALASELLDEPRFLSVALSAAEATYQYGDHRKNPTFCTGLAGGGELLVEAYRISGEKQWLERAREFAVMAGKYRTTIDGQDYWPTDEPECFSADFTYGAAGTGYFFLRASQPPDFPAPLM